MKFSTANTKLKKLQKKIRRKVYSFDLLSGHTCPGAKDCHAMVEYNWELDQYKLVDGPDQQFRCYSASQEAQYDHVYNNRLQNWEDVSLYRSANLLATALCSKLPEDAETVRWHSAGDFFNKVYFLAAILVAKRNPDKIFYAYTKFLPAWVKFRNQIPDNFVLTASRGGRWDHLIDEHGLREVVVVFSEEEAAELGLELDDDDSHAARPELRNQNFALLIHGNGQAGSRQAKAHAKRRKSKVPA
jgi:hypothetical protein